VKFAFSTLACPKWSIEEVIEHSTKMGYDGVELRLLNGQVIDPVRDDQAVKGAVLLSRDQGLDVCALDTSCRLNQNDPLERARQIDALRIWIELAHETHVPVLRIFGGEVKPDVDPKPAPELEDTWMVEALGIVAIQAEQAGVTVALETHDAFSSGKRVGTILQQVDSPAIGVLWDSHHTFRCGETTDEVLSLFKNHIAHVHIKDSQQIPNSDTVQYVLMGEGQVPVAEQLQKLSQIGYNGYISVEWEKLWHPELADPEIALPEYIAWLKTWQASQPPA
jgi:sugar phosphate isomerase/epimerase